MSTQTPLAYFVLHPQSMVRCSPRKDIFCTKSSTGARGMKRCGCENNPWLSEFTNRYDEKLSKPTLWRPIPAPQINLSF